MLKRVQREDGTYIMCDIYIYMFILFALGVEELHMIGLAVWWTISTEHSHFCKANSRSDIRKTPHPFSWEPNPLPFPVHKVPPLDQITSQVKPLHVIT